MYMLGMLLYKTKKRGVSLAITTLPTDVSTYIVFCNTPTRVSYCSLFFHTL